MAQKLGCAMFEEGGGFKLDDELARARAKRDAARDKADADKSKHFELIPFDKITFDTTPAYLVKDEGSKES